MDPDGLDLSPQGTTAGEAGQEGQLHRGRDVRAGLRDDQQVRRVAVDGLEGRLIGSQIPGAAYAIPGGAKLISGQQAHDRGNITGLGAPDGDTGRPPVQRLENLHLPSLPASHSGREVRQPVPQLSRS